MKKAFIEHRFNRKQEGLISTANTIIATYMASGLRLTLRQLYYQFVAHHGLPNTERSYKSLGRLLSLARLAGLVDWDAIEDRGRKPDNPSEWDSVEEIVEAAINQFRLPRWEGQENHVELWVEKQALAGVLEPVAHRHHITLQVNKGYSSQSAMYDSAIRFRASQKPGILLYLGDHDPSGEDMVRDVRDRLAMFGARVRVKKVALTMAQVEEHNPPPNPAKISDSRAQGYIARHGDESWEVDALDPHTLVKLIETEIKRVVDQKLLAKVLKEEAEQRLRVREALGIA